MVVIALCSCWNLANSAVKSIGLRVLAYALLIIGSTGNGTWAGLVYATGAGFWVKNCTCGR